MANDQPVTLGALNRVESKINTFIENQQKVNDKVFNSMAELNDTLKNIDVTLKIFLERDAFLRKEFERMDIRITDNDRTTRGLFEENLKHQTTLNTIRFILFACIPLISTILGLIMYFR